MSTGIGGLKSRLLEGCGIGTAGVAETMTKERVARVGQGGPDPETVVAKIAGAAALRRAPRLDGVAEAAAFLASDRARAWPAP